MQEQIKLYDQAIVREERSHAQRVQILHHNRRMLGRYGIGYNTDITDEDLAFQPSSFVRWFFNDLDAKKHMREMERNARERRKLDDEFKSKLPLTLTIDELQTFKFPPSFSIKLDAFRKNQYASITFKLEHGHIIYSTTKTEESKDARTDFLASLPKTFAPKELRATFKSIGIKAVLDTATSVVDVEKTANGFVCYCKNARGDVVRTIRSR